jgi:predicted nuclease of predicted toxin-antitoxin system
VKLLFDANISRKIVPMIQDLFPASSQILLIGFSGETPDKAIWDYAQENNFTIVSADFDFIRLSNRFGAPPKVVRLDRMDYSTRITADLIRRNAVAISEFGSSSRAILLLPRSQTER